MQRIGQRSDQKPLVRAHGILWMMVNVVHEMLTSSMSLIGFSGCGLDLSSSASESEPAGVPKILGAYQP